MKTAVIYYSLDGNCALVAEEIKTKLNAELIRLHTKNEKECKGIAKFFYSFGLMFKKYPQLKPYAFDPSAYDLIIIGAPVWAGSPASPVKTFIRDAGISNRKIALFVCHAGGIGKALEKFKSSLPGNSFTGEIDFESLLKKDSEEVKQKIAEWAVKLGS
jgi:flavodoxin